MAGIDRNTGKMIDGWPNVAQKLVVLFSTRIGSRFRRRTVGSSVPPILGENITLATILRFKTALIVAAELWEPRFAITRIASNEDKNTPESIRIGALQLEILGEYRPRGHLGDPTPDTLERRLTVGRRADGNMEIL